MLRLDDATANRSMIAPSPTGSSTYVDAPIMTAAGPVLSPPRTSDLGGSQIPAGSQLNTTGGTAGSATATGTAKPTSLADILKQASNPTPTNTGTAIGGHTLPAPTAQQVAPPATAADVNGSAQAPATAATMPPATATPGSTATPASAANVAATAAAAPTPAQQTGTAAPSVTTGTGASTVTRTPLTGQEAPYTVQPGVSSALQSLLERAQAAVTQQLDQPTVWDDELAGRVKDAARRGIDENFTQQGDALDAELAGRGLNWSSIAGSRLTDLGTRKAQALSDLDTSIAQQRANSIAAGRSAALGNLQSLLGLQNGIERGVQADARTERDYTDATRTQAHDQALNEYLIQHGLTMQDAQAWQDAINTGLQYGTGSAGTAALGQAAATNNAAGAQYGAQASDASSAVGQLAQLLMQFYGGK